MELNFVLQNVNSHVACWMGSRAHGWNLVLLHNTKSVCCYLVHVCKEDRELVVLYVIDYVFAVGIPDGG